MDWLNAGALSFMLMMLVGTFHLGAILTGEVGTVARNAANLVDVKPLIEQVNLPNYVVNPPPYGVRGPVSSNATLKKVDDSEEQDNETPIENPSEKHCKLLGGNYSEGNCRFGPNVYFSKPGLFRYR